MITSILDAILDKLHSTMQAQNMIKSIIEGVLDEIPSNLMQAYKSSSTINTPKSDSLAFNTPKSIMLSKALKRKARDSLNINTAKKRAKLLLESAN